MKNPANLIATLKAEIVTTATPNIDPEEIAKFEKLASRWWDPDSEFKPLHDINPLRLEYILKQTMLDGKQVLDVGCGGGILSEALAKSGAQVTGIDMGDAPLNVARLHGLEANISIDYQKTTAEEFATRHPQKFDVLTCMEMLEHVPDPASTIQACATLVKPGGKLFFSTINRNPKSYLFAIIGAEYLLKILPKGTHQYSKFIKPSELAHWLRHAETTVQNVIGLTYNPLSKQYKLENDVSVNFMVVAEKIATN